MAINYLVTVQKEDDRGSFVGYKIASDDVKRVQDYVRRTFSPDRSRSIQYFLDENIEAQMFRRYGLANTDPICV